MCEFIVTELVIARGTGDPLLNRTEDPSGMLISMLVSFGGGNELLATWKFDHRLLDGPLRLFAVIYMNLILTITFPLFLKKFLTIFILKNQISPYIVLYVINVHYEICRTYTI